MITLSVILAFIGFLFIPLGHILYGIRPRRAHPLTKFVLTVLGVLYTPFIRIGWMGLLDQRLFRNPLLRWAPVLFGWIITKVNYGGEVYSLQELEYLFNNIYARHPDLHIVLSPCVCRHTLAHYEEGKPALSCIHLQFMADAFVKALPKDARFISPAVAIELIRKWDKMGYCHLLYGFCPQQDSFNWSKQIALCACGKHCIVVHGHNKLSSYTACKPLKQSPWLAEVEPAKCLGLEKCGRCRVCSFFAIEEVNGLAKVDDAKCMGCGVCVNHCRRGALKLKERPGVTRNRFINPAIMHEEIKPLTGWRKTMSEKTAGVLLLAASIAGMLLAAFFVVLVPALGIDLGVDPYKVGYWSMAILLLLILFIALMMIAWLGYSTFVTPPAQISAEELHALEEMEHKLRQAALASQEPNSENKVP